MKLITGNDNVDSWQKHTWDAILKDARMVVSTPQVLYDALAHAYLRMSDLSLIVIDEGSSTPSSSDGQTLT
jgi:ERCC4-related helicase